MLHNRWTMTCEYGLQRTGRTLSIDLPIRRLGVRVLPSAPSSTAISPLGGATGARGVCRPPRRTNGRVAAIASRTPTASHAIASQPVTRRPPTRDSRH